MSDSQREESLISLRMRTDKHMARQLQRPQLVPRPPIQRKNCWSNKDNSDFIDTIARGWRCTIYIITKVDEDIDEDEEDVYVDHIFDGAHKVEAGIMFVNNQFVLEKIPEKSPLKEHEGKKFSELPLALRSKIQNYQFTINYIDEETANDKDALKILWERLNKAGKKLNDYELALPVIHDLVHDVLAPASVDFLGSEIFKKEQSNRGEVEKILQLILATSECDFKDKDASYLRDFSSKKNLIKKWQDKYLGQKITDIKKNTAENKEKWCSNLKLASNYLKTLAENNCFVDKDGNSILQTAYRGTELVFLLGRSVYHFSKAPEFRRICPDLSREIKEKFFEKITRNEAGRNGLLQRKLLKDIDEIVKKYADMKTPRLFSKEMKERKLKEQNHICASCKLKIHPHQEYHGDHIKKYADGGETAYENLQILHAHCNLTK